MGKLLEVNNLHYHYGAIHALKGVSIEVDQHEIVTLVGANGAGKTTFLRTISGLLDPSGIEGTIIFQGKPIQKMSAHKIAALGLRQVLEGRHIFSQLSVEENIMVGAYLRKDMPNVKEEINRIWKQFPRLFERRKQMGGTLSGGEQQMLAIARALIGNPDLIMMDEPSLGLAPIIVSEIFEIIRNINKEGTPVLLVEQNCNMALQTAHRGYVLETGEVVMHDQCSRLLNNRDIKRSYLGS